MKTLLVILRDDYGKPEQGESYEYRYFTPALQRFGEVEVFDFGPYLADQSGLQTAVVETASRSKPDLIFFCLYEDQFTSETLDRLREIAPTVNWFCDDQWRGAFFDRYAPHFTHSVVTNPYRTKGAIQSQWAAKQVDWKSRPVRFKYDVSFVGWRLPYREWFVNELAKNGIHVECFGTGWPNGRLTYPEVEEVFRRSKINLNISNSRQYDVRYVLNYGVDRHGKTSEQVKGRHFEIPAAGGFQLTNYCDFLEDSFAIGDEIAIYNTVDDAERKIRWYLDRPELREWMIVAAGERVERDHLYDYRFKVLFSKMELQVAA